ncbi:hypothetical protein AX769_08290 [Frondihabitans sp. PAMC 28766]|uniref:hypothetical protein n=1 Tax=Frondihabitans sp. PAMC 28766 TaxID=1795630 RepID=UPI00078E8A67|nr:hypothetical protein [Frondihabitans sp. PAMC 28766]AMM20166.1 hypothetical protein AX769_08290 [Frondihabitans sp. PAMC 28766]
MNSTNRGLNRALLCVLGLILLVVGASVAAAAAIPGYFTGWKTGQKTVQQNAADAIKNTALGSTGHSWLLIIAVALAVVVIILLLMFILRQGHGHTNRLVRVGGETKHRDTPTGGAVFVDAQVAEQAIGAALKDYDNLASSNVTAYRVKGTPTLKITANTRRGVSPADVRRHIDQIVTAWDSILGQDVPVMIQINTGLLARTTKTSRVAGDVA